MTSTQRRIILQLACSQAVVCRLQNKAPSDVKNSLTKAPTYAPVSLSRGSVTTVQSSNVERPQIPRPTDQRWNAAAPHSNRLSTAWHNLGNPASQCARAAQWLLGALEQVLKCLSTRCGSCGECDMRGDEHTWTKKRGGVFFETARVMDEKSRTDTCTVLIINRDAAAGSLARVLRLHHHQHHHSGGHGTRIGPSCVPLRQVAVSSAKFSCMQSRASNAVARVGPNGPGVNGKRGPV